MLAREVRAEKEMVEGKAVFDRGREILVVVVVVDGDDEGTIEAIHVPALVGGGRDGAGPGRGGPAGRIMEVPWLSVGNCR